MQSIFLACYLCLQLIALNHQDQTSLHQKESSCNECLTGVIEKLHLPSNLADQVEHWLSIKKPASELISSNPDFAVAIEKQVQEQTVSTTESPTDGTKQGPNGKVVEKLIPKGRSSLKNNERIMAGQSLVSQNQEYVATLNDLGMMIIINGNGTVIETWGCELDEPSKECNWFFTPTYGLREYKKIETDLDHYICTSAIPIICTREGVRCYLNLDDDGKLRLYSEEGVYQTTFSSGHCPAHDESVSHENSISVDSEEIEFKGRSTLKRNERLFVNDSLVSENRKYKAFVDHYGNVKIIDTRHNLIYNNNSSCWLNTPYSNDWNLMMNSKNSYGMYQTAGKETAKGIWHGGSSWDCRQPDVECYLKLDNDGKLKMFTPGGLTGMDL